MSAFSPRTLRRMDQVPFGSTDLRVSRLCLGTMQFGWTADEQASFAVMDAFVKAGGNFLDTADIYSNWVRGKHGGESERIIPVRESGQDLAGQKGPDEGRQEGSRGRDREKTRDGDRHAGS